MARFGADDRNAVVDAQPILGPNWFLASLPREFWNVRKEPFIYAFTPQLFGLLPNTNMTPGQTVQAAVQIDRKAHFWCMGGTCISWVANSPGNTVLNTESNGTWTGTLIAIQDAATGAPLVQGSLIPMDCILGSGVRPARWPVPKLFRKGGGISVTLKTLAVSGSIGMPRLEFHGLKLFPDEIEREVA